MVDWPAHMGYTAARSLVMCVYKQVGHDTEYHAQITK